MDDQVRTVDEIVKFQKKTPIYLTNGTLDNALDDDDDPEFGKKLFDRLGLDYGPPATNMPEEGEDFYPLTEAELDFVGEDIATGPYGGAEMSYAMLYKGHKYIAPHIMVCFNGPDRPFSIESYGDHNDSIYETSAVALSEAKRLASFVKPQMEALGGMAYVNENAEIDRHAVCLLFPVKSVLKTFGVAPASQRFEFFKGFVASILEGYKPRPSKING